MLHFTLWAFGHSSKKVTTIMSCIVGSPEILIVDSEGTEVAALTERSCNYGFGMQQSSDSVPNPNPDSLQPKELVKCLNIRCFKRPSMPSGGRRAILEISSLSSSHRWKKNNSLNNNLGLIKHLWNSKSLSSQSSSSRIQHVRSAYSKKTAKCLFYYCPFHINHK